jgi:hypothetical protein
MGTDVKDHLWITTVDGEEYQFDEGTYTALDMPTYVDVIKEGVRFRFFKRNICVAATKSTE